MIFLFSAQIFTLRLQAYDKTYVKMESGNLKFERKFDSATDFDVTTMDGVSFMKYDKNMALAKNPQSNNIKGVAYTGKENQKFVIIENDLNSTVNIVYKINDKSMCLAKESNVLTIKNCDKNDNQNFRLVKEDPVAVAEALEAEKRKLKEAEEVKRKEQERLMQEEQVRKEEEMRRKIEEEEAQKREELKRKFEELKALKLKRRKCLAEKRAAELKKQMAIMKCIMDQLKGSDKKPNPPSKVNDKNVINKVLGNDREKPDFATKQDEDKSNHNNQQNYGFLDNASIHEAKDKSPNYDFLDNAHGQTAQDKVHSNNELFKPHDKNSSLHTDVKTTVGPIITENPETERIGAVKRRLK